MTRSAHRARRTLAADQPGGEAPRPQFSEPPLGDDGILPIVAPWDSPSVRRYVVRDGKLVEASP